jgi:hypothetical protein
MPGRFESTVRRHKFQKYFLSLGVESGSGSDVSMNHF